MSQRWSILLRDLESIKFYMLRESKTWPLLQFDFPSSAMHLSGVDSKAEFFKPLEGSSKTLLADRVRTTNSVLILDCPLPAMSSVDNDTLDNHTLTLTISLQSVSRELSVAARLFSPLRTASELKSDPVRLYQTTHVTQRFPQGKLGLDVSQGMRMWVPATE